MMRNNVKKIKGENIPKTDQKNFYTVKAEKQIIRLHLFYYLLMQFVKNCLKAMQCVPHLHRSEFSKQIIVSLGPFGTLKQYVA